MSSSTKKEIQEMLIRLYLMASSLSPCDSKEKLFEIVDMMMIYLRNEE